MPQRLLKTKYLFIADRNESAFFIADGWNRLSMCRPAPNCSPKTFKPQRAQRKLRIVSRSGRRVIRVQNIPGIPGFHAELLESTKTCRGKCPGICNVRNLQDTLKKVCETPHLFTSCSLAEI